MGQVGDLISAQGAAAAGVLGPAEHPRLEEGAIDDQLSAALEQVEQANLTLGPVELVLLLHRHPRHPSTLSGQRITGMGQGLLFYEELLPRSLPLLLRHDRGCLHRDTPFQVLLVSLLACCHLCRHRLFLPSSGGYTDTNGTLHGYLRTATGTVRVFDAPNVVPRSVIGAGS